MRGDAWFCELEKGKAENQVTLPEALTALLDEYELESFERVYLDDAKADDAYQGFSFDHPKVQRFRAICAVLREAKTNNAKDR